MKIRVGLGFDVHQLEEGRDFFLGGIKLPSDIGAVGHSDADVLIHPGETVSTRTPFGVTSFDKLLL